MHGWCSRGTSYPLYAPRTQGVGVSGQKNHKNLPTLEDHICTKFHPDPSSGLDFYREQTIKPTLPFI